MAVPSIPTVHGVAPVFGLCSASPFVVKLCTWLRMAQIPHHYEPLRSLPRSRTGKVPYLTFPDGRILEDSQVIIETLAAERGIDPWAGLGAAERARGHALRRLAEDSLYWSLIWDRWLDAGWPLVRGEYFRVVPGLLRPIVAHQARRKVRAMVRGQGMGRRPRAEILDQARQDLLCLADCLGDQDFFLGPPTVVDAARYGPLAQIRGATYGGGIQPLLAAHPRLLAFVDRVADRWWSSEASLLVDPAVAEAATAV